MHEYQTVKLPANGKKTMSINNASSKSEESEDQKKYKEEMKKIFSPSAKTKDEEIRANYKEIAEDYQNNPELKSQAVIFLPESKTFNNENGKTCYGFLSGLCFQRQILSQEIFGTQKYNTNWPENNKIPIVKGDINKAFTNSFARMFKNHAPHNQYKGKATICCRYM